MSDLEPLLSETTCDDLYVTRVLVRKLTPEVDFRVLGSTGTSISIVAIDEATQITRQLEVERDAQLKGLRCEVLLMTDGERSDHWGPRSQGRRPIRPKVFPKPSGGRACVLADAMDRASNEFVIVCGSVSSPLSGLSNVLAHMWTEGADIAVLAREENQLATANADVAAALPGWLGLGSSISGPQTLVMRRWLARWIFNEIDRAINPMEEIADRVRLLGVTIIYAAVRGQDTSTQRTAS